MNNLKKVGLSALAGSLAMMSASTADITVGGSGEVTYTSEDGNDSSNGNPWGVSQTISFTGTGELDNGYSYKFYTEMAGVDMTSDSSYVQFDAGDMGKFGIDQGVGQYGIGTIALSIPTAYEEADHAVGLLADGLDVTGDTQTLGYINTFAGLSVNVEINPNHGNATKSEAGGHSGSAASSTGSNINWALKYALPNVEGLELRLGASETDITNAGETDDQEWTAAVRYVVGPVSLGYQQSEIQSGTAATNGENVQAYGVAFNVNDNLSISYGVNKNESDATGGTSTAAAENITEKSTGIQASYTMGSASFRIANNEATGVNGVSGAKDENTEISLSLSF
jgi:outer membrane protein OmpU